MFKSLLARVREARGAELEEEGGLEAGFTLIELMVVLLIMGILLAIAIPTFLGVSGSAHDRAAQSNLTTALTDSIAYYQNAQTYDASSGQSTNELNTECSQGAGTCSSTSPAVDQTTKAAMQSQEPSYTWTTGACTAASPSNCVSVAPVDVASSGDGQGIILAAYSSNDNTCWYVMNLQATPEPGATIADATAADAFDGSTSATTLPSGVTAAGTFYAKTTGTTSCTATTAETGAWGSSYTKAGAA